MTDDICGAECVDGSGCQHPAGSCPIPGHSDDDADNPQGRDFVIDDADHEDILDAARNGLSKAGCARAAGVNKQNLHRYLESDENQDFRDAFRRARAQGETKIVTGGLADDDVDPSMAKFLLASSFGYTKSEKREVEHSGDGIEVIADFTTDE